MMAGPEDGIAAGRGHLRASQADREQVIDVLKAAFVQGRLAKDEFEARVVQTFVSRTYGELAAVTAGLTRAQPVRAPAPAKVAKPNPTRARAKTAAVWGSFGIVLPALFAAIVVPGSANISAAIGRTAVVFIVFWLIGSFVMIANADW